MKHSRHFALLLLAAGPVLIFAACSNVEPDAEQVRVEQARVEQARAKEAPEAMIADASVRNERRLEEVIVTASRIASTSKSLALQTMAAPGIMPPMPHQPAAGERYENYQGNGVCLVSEEPVSTFSIDVDTGSYSNVRRFLNHGQMPPADAVRVEEMINYFSYGYDTPADPEQPFNVTTEVAPSPFNAGRHLLMVGLKGYEVSERLPANFVFLIDVSGSMQAPSKLGLVKSSLRMLTRHLGADDRIGIVTYAGNAGVVLEPVAGDKKPEIEAAIDELAAGGSTYGQGGLIEAYRLARNNFTEGNINRVILLTDGDFNVGISSVEALKDFISQQRDSGIGLTALGFGMGNYNDTMLEQLADVGNGNYAYIDNLNEAKRVLVDQASSTFQTIASDVKIQVEFNPRVVAEYRLVGYENRLLAREDFNNDRVDAGEIGAGHTVTAIYEIGLVGSEGLAIDPLRYSDDTAIDKYRDDELAFVKLRYKRPGEQTSKRISVPVNSKEMKAEPGQELAFAAAVAGFGQLLAQDEHATMSYGDVHRLAAQSAGSIDPSRIEFINLVALAMELAAPLASR